MKVYLVEWWDWGYESGISAVFSTEGKAEAWIEGRKAGRIGGIHTPSDYAVLEFEVDETPDETPVVQRGGTSARVDPEAGIDPQGE